MKKFESRDTMPEPSGIPKPGDEEAETEEIGRKPVIKCSGAGFCS